MTWRAAPKSKLKMASGAPLESQKVEVSPSVASRAPYGSPLAVVRAVLHVASSTSTSSACSAAIVPPATPIVLDLGVVVVDNTSSPTAAACDSEPTLPKKGSVPSTEGGAVDTR